MKSVILAMTHTIWYRLNTAGFSAFDRMPETETTECVYAVECIDQTLCGGFRLVTPCLTLP